MWQASSKVGVSCANVSKTTSTSSADSSNVKTSGQHASSVHSGCYEQLTCSSTNSSSALTTAHYDTHCDTLLAGTDTLLAVTLTQMAAVGRTNPRSRTFDASSLYSVTSDEFNESDDELISINGDAPTTEYTHPLYSPRLSGKRTTTLTADLEVESLLSRTGDDSPSSGDNLSVSDFPGILVVGYLY